MRLDDEKFLRRFGTEFEKLFPDNATFKEIISAIEDYKLPIEKDGRDTAKKIDISAIKEIENALPHLIKITEKPHSFIKTYEEKIHVSTAKRINSKAISHLSRDSNDWFARTFLTIIPKNILSDINEETFDLYENRFIVTLIDRILNEVINERISCEKVFEELSNDRIQNKLMQRGYIPMQKDSNVLSRKLLRNKKNNIGNNATFEEISTYLNQILSLEKKIRNMKQSRLYSDLKKCRHVQNPIQKTNILVFDPRYNTAYRLWEYLDKNFPDEVIEIDETEKECLPVWYNLFVLVTISGSLKDMGFDIIDDGKIQYQNNKLSLDKPSQWGKKDEVIQLFYANNKVELNYQIDKLRNKWDKVIIIPNILIDFENISSVEVHEQTDNMLNELTSHSNRKGTEESWFYFISLDIHKCSDSNDWGEIVYRRLFNIGDNYSNEEKNKSKLSFYQTGVLIVSPDDFRVNFLRIQRLINSRIYKNKIEEVHKNTCPICGSNNIRRPNNNNDEIICNTCFHYISKSSCSNPECKADFLWIRYRDNNFLEDKEITDNFETGKYYIKLGHSETMMGEYAITSFSIEKDVGSWKLKSICPKCGRILGG